ncbi:MAG: hypothetical protein IT526_01210, partial [Nitrosomonas sp.]|nr:hypothetical protein [Nitrosomonas sp.]
MIDSRSTPSDSAMVAGKTLSLEFGMTFPELYTHAGLVRLDQIFLDYLNEGDHMLHHRLIKARHDPESLAAKDESALLIEVAPWLEDFIAILFGIKDEVNALAA